MSSLSDDAPDVRKRPTGSDQHQQHQQQQQQQQPAVDYSSGDTPVAHSNDQGVTYYWYYEFELPFWLLGLAGVWLTVVLALFSYICFGESAHQADMMKAFGVAYPMDDHANPPVRHLSVGSKELIDRLGRENARLYALLDKDGNGLVSLSEFESLVHHVRQDWEHPATKRAAGESDGRSGCLGDGDSPCLQLRYRMTPGRVYQRYDRASNSLATVVVNDNNNANNASNNTETDASFALNFPPVSTDTDSSRIGVSSVAMATAFLPDNPVHLTQLRVGEPYGLLGPPPDGSQFYLGKQRRIRPSLYFEPREVALSDALLRPLHRFAFLYARHTGADRDSACAVLTAESPTHLELAFRLHPEFQLANSSAKHSVYLTPPGLEGRAIVRKHGGDNDDHAAAVRPATVAMLEMSMPASFDEDCGLACATYWHVESTQDIVEIGQFQVPELTVSSTPPSGQSLDAWSQSHQWSSQIPLSDAFNLLRARMLPHLGARFHDNLGAAIKAAGESGKPIHAVLAIGGQQFACDANCRALRDLAFGDELVRLRLRHYYTNVWINLADASAFAEFQQLTSHPDQPLQDPNDIFPLWCSIIDPKTHRILSQFTDQQLRKAMIPPDGLPNPFPPAVFDDSDTAAGRHGKAPRQPRLVPPTPDELMAEAEAEEAREPEERRRRETAALDAVRKQVAEAYLRFMTSSKA